jgi:hypothetical protein
MDAYEKQRRAVYKHIPKFERRRIADPEAQRAIAQLVDYLQVDEFNHFAGEPDHIFHAVRTVRDWLGWPGRLKDEDAIVAELKQQYRDEQLLPLGKD